VIQQLTQLQRENEQLKNRLLKRLQLTHELRNWIKRASFEPPPKLWTPDTTNQKKKRVVACLLFSDWHIGGQIEPQEIRNTNKYNTQIAAARLQRITQDFIKYIYVQRQGYRIDTCVVLGLGDYISGNIHDELMITQEFPVTKQAVTAGKLLAKQLHTLYPHFKKLKFYGLSADNHGRLTKRTQYKESGLNNLSYITLEVARLLCRQLFSSKDYHIITNISDLITINGKKFLVTHGHTIKMWMGIPYYGLERMRSREILKMLRTEHQGFDYIVLGHFHCPAMIQDMIINGALCGTTEFDYAHGRFSFPSQTAFLVHQKHGVFNTINFTIR